MYLRILRNDGEKSRSQFHIANDEAKKNVFLSAVAQRFRDFKAKLVSGWITKRRKVGGTKKKKIYGRATHSSSEASQDTSFEAPSKFPYQIWRHITPEEWQAFVAQKTTPEAVASREKNSANAKARKYYHHLGSQSYGQARESWMYSHYPTIASTTASGTSSTTTVAQPRQPDRVLDWWCSMHGVDAKGHRRFRHRARFRRFTSFAAECRSWCTL
ncbi:uncharacterized protein LOC130589484 [Beta vulgaris subsp. vulgaris]|uniref:uncharacterized protein LOC130589484 n=1 Tax=Beta vulgaris subsp. vulgaris TaxID=3555 RepID=UPI002549A98E|nr:uncharacterized protein LOC130589484 [Beta vulgaris subsp. vulgaris]